MCELAFNVNGERFVPPATCEAWRVRRLKPGGRGMPEVVFDQQGTPLVIPMDTEVAEFRRLVGNEPGRYRLDPVDADSKPCEDAIPAYLQISGNGGASAPPEAAASRSGDAHIDLIRDVVRTNSEMVKTIADKFALVMQSAAELIRAADGAGMPRREPVVAELRNADADEDEEDDGIDEEPATGFVGLLQHLRPFAELVNNIMDTQGAAHRVPAVAPRNGTPRNGASGHGGQTSPAHSDESEEAKASEPPRPFNMVSHLSAIEVLLSAEEMQAVRAQVGKMKPTEMQEWSQRIAGLSPEQAAELIRVEIRGGKGGGQ